MNGLTLSISSPNGGSGIMTTNSGEGMIDCGKFDVKSEPVDILDFLELKQETLDSPDLMMVKEKKSDLKPHFMEVKFEPIDRSLLAEVKKEPLDSVDAMVWKRKSNIYSQDLMNVKNETNDSQGSICDSEILMVTPDVIMAVEKENEETDDE
ncbi:hypothetical protein Hamer_G017401 [Homarus americanus]|uniref:Uncharacterized protein n=2 Tax=Homarus americanus TaxID=6706 RepID=A0A8J5JLP6_HOMAM|nr:hypothetical protein Hamer_G017401 [Homarus americanus]